jgi:tetratricopeptide (TPR) repeat protein
MDIKITLCVFYTDVPGLMGGDIDKAKVLANQLLKQKPDEGYRRMGDIYVKEKKLKEAEAEYFKMVKSNPEKVSVLAKYYMKQKQYDKAYLYYEEAIKKNPEDFNSMYQIGKISAITEQHLDRGEEYLKKYLTHQPIEREPSHAEANMRLGQIYENRGNKAEAKRLYQLALKQDSELDEAEAGLERLK